MEQDKSKRLTRSLAISSGKGGVGKSNIAVNTALALAKQGERVCLFDADTGLANVNILLDLHPEFTIADVINETKELPDIIVRGPYDLAIVPGATGIAEATELTPKQQRRLITALKALEQHFDYLFIDTAAGIGQDVLHFIGAAQQTLIVVTPEPTSLTDAFSLIKTLKKQNHQHTINIVVNRCRDASQGQAVFKRLAGASAKYLHTDLRFLCYLLEDASISAGVSQQQPVMLLPEDIAANRSFKLLAKSIQRSWAIDKSSSQVSEYFQALTNEQESEYDQQAISNSSKTVEQLMADIQLWLDNGQWTQQQVSELLAALNSQYQRQLPPVSMVTPAPQITTADNTDTAVSHLVSNLKKRSTTFYDARFGKQEALIHKLQRRDASQNLDSFLKELLNHRHSSAEVS